MHVLILNVTRYIKDKCPGREVWTGLQTYKSDKEPTPVPKEELEADIMAALKGGATGCVLFRLGLIDPKFWGGSNGS